MKPQRFENGQEVICVDDRWFDANDQSPVTNGPKLHDVVVVRKYASYWNNQWYIELEGYPEKDSFGEEAFEPLISDKELYEQLEEVEEPV